jgi:hypothetical protein
VPVQTTSRAYSNKPYLNFSLLLLGQAKTLSIPQTQSLIILRGEKKKKRKKKRKKEEEEKNTCEFTAARWDK